MLFPSKELRLIEYKKGNGKTSGAPYAFAKFADEKTFENVTFSVHRDQLEEDFPVQTRYSVSLDVTESQGKSYVSARLTPTK